MNIDVTTLGAGKGGRVDLPTDLFGIEPNMAVMHQVVTAQLAHRRAGTHSTKTRAEVAGGGAKPWRQKGTGRARQGSIRAPQWRGGGIAHGPKPRDYSQRTPKKMVRLALRSALSDRAAESRVKVVDGWGIDSPRTKQAIEALETLGLRTKGERPPRVLLVLDRNEHAVWKSFRNLGKRVQIALPEELNAYDVLVNDWIVFSTTTLDAAIAHFSSPGAADEGDDTGDGDGGVTAAEAPADNAEAADAEAADDATEDTETPE